MLSLAFDLAAFGDPDAFADDVPACRVGQASPPIAPGGKVLLPGEIEEGLRRERLAEGLPIDDATWLALSATAASVGVSPPME